MRQQSQTPGDVRCCSSESEVQPAQGSFTRSLAAAFEESTEFKVCNPECKRNRQRDDDHSHVACLNLLTFPSMDRQDFTNHRECRTSSMNLSQMLLSMSGTVTLVPCYWPFGSSHGAERLRMIDGRISSDEHNIIKHSTTYDSKCLRLLLLEHHNAHITTSATVTRCMIFSKSSPFQHMQEPFVTSVRHWHTAQQCEMRIAKFNKFFFRHAYKCTQNWKSKSQIGLVRKCRDDFIIPSWNSKSSSAGWSCAG